MTIIRIEQFLNGDGFTVIVKDEFDNIREQVRYDYFYNVARNEGDTYKGFGKEILPTVQEILSNYEAPFTVIPGRNVFADRPVHEDVVNAWIEKYMGGN